MAMDNSQELTLDQIHFISDIKKSLLSGGQLYLQGYSTIFIGGAWKVVHGTRLIAPGSKRDSFYSLSGQALQ